MTRITRLNTIDRLAALATCLTLACAATMVKADPPADSAKKEPAKSGATDPAKPTTPPSGPTPTAGAQPPAPTPVRPPDVPAPTVVNKPGEVPKVKFDTPTYDFGRIRAGEEIRKDFWFTNTGTGKLEILKVRPSCGCTTAGEHDKIVEPGKTGKIPLKVGTTNFNGPITKTVTVNTNVEGSDSTITLQIKGEVWQLVQVMPNNATFGRVTSEDAKGGTLIRKLTIVNNSEKKADFKVANSTSPAFKADIKELEAGKKYEMTVTLAGALSTGMTSGNIELSTGLDEMAKVSVPVNAFLTADVDVTPNRLTLPTGRTTPLQRFFYVRNNGPKPVKVSDLAVSNPKLKTTITETTPGSQYKITLDIPADYKVSEKGDTLTFKTDNSAVPTLSIPITEINYGGNPAMKAAGNAPTGAPTGPALTGKPGEAKPAPATADAAKPKGGH